MSETAALPPPDIKTDRLVIVQGATCIPVDATGHGFFRIGNHAPVWIERVPTEDTLPAEWYPHQSHFCVTHEMVVGTVDEIVEDFREKLTHCYHAMAHTPKAGEPQPDLPFFGEPSWRKQNEALAAHGYGGPGAVAVPSATHAELDRFQQKRNRLNNHTPRQCVEDRARLFQAVALALDCNPTLDPKLIQHVIDALVILKEDAEAENGAASL